MHHLGYKSCLADPDLWYKPEVREEDKSKYYSYVLLYVDDCLCIHHSAEEEINKIDVFQDEVWINRGPRYQSWSQGQANKSEQWSNSIGNQPNLICKQSCQQL